MSSEFERYVNSDFVINLHPKEFATFDVLASESTFSTSERVLSIRRTRLTPASLEMCMCLKDHLDAKECKQEKCPLKAPLDFEEDVFDDEVQRNEAISLSDEEIALDANASSEGTLSLGGPRQKGHPRLKNTTRLHLESKFTEIVGGYHSARTNQSYEERIASLINHSKKLNNQAVFHLISGIMQEYGNNDAASTQTFNKGNRNVQILRNFAKDQNIKYFYDITDHRDFMANPEYKGLCHNVNAQEGYCKPREEQRQNHRELSQEEVQTLECFKVVHCCLVSTWIMSRVDGTRLQSWIVLFRTIAGDGDTPIPKQQLEPMQVMKEDLPSRKGLKAS
nr:3-isopropylmalate dehydratase large subunit, chloroplastic-like [Tanacetum cinerariifolium]